MKKWILMAFSLILVLPLAAQETAPGEVTVTYENFTLTYDEALGGEVSLSTIPAVEAADDEVPYWEFLPEHHRIDFDQYPLQREAIPAWFTVIPLTEFAETGDETASESIQQLHRLLNGRPDLEDEESLPYIPLNPAQQVFFAQAEYLDFEQGSGIRYVTSYRQDVSPLTEEDAIYTFQGITKDGRYVLSASFPVLTNLLPEEVDMENFDTEAFLAGHEQYLEDTRDDLSALSAEEFTPPLIMLDELVQSIQFTDAPRTISWEEARELILSGQVATVFQAHDLTVTLGLLNAETVITEEPEIDAVFDVLDACGEPCANIVPATE